MSQNNDVRSCPKCGALVSTSLTKCGVCGAVLDAKDNAAVGVTRSRSESRIKYGREEDFYAGGASVTTHKSSQAVRSNAKKQALVMFVIAVTLCLIFFAPFVSVRTQYNDMSAYDVKLSSLDFLNMGIKAMSYHNVTALKQTDEYLSYQLLANQVAVIPKDGSVSSNHLAILAEYAKSSITVYLMRSEVSAKFNLNVALVMSAIYIITAIVALMLSMAALVANRSEKEPKKQTALGGAKKTLLFLITITPAYVMALLHAGHFSLSGIVNGFGGLGTRMAWGAVLCMLLFAAGVFQVCKKRIDGILGEKDNRVRFSALTGVIALACATIAVFAMFTACITVKTVTPYGNRRGVAIKAGDVYEFNYDDVYYYTQRVNTATEESLADMAMDICDGVVSSRESLQLFNTCAFWSGDVSGLYTFLAVVQIISLIFLGIITKKLILRIVDGDKGEKPQFSLLVGTFASLMYLGLSIALSFLCYTNLPTTVGRYVLFTIGIGPIFVILGVAGVIVSLTLRQPKSVAVQYDRPDVSYAPYVI